MSEKVKKTILLVEDEVLIAMMERMKLESENYNVLHTATGESAIDLVCVKREPVDLILMDIDLGSGIDGTETAKQILKCTDVPILFLSSHTEKEIVTKTESITNYGYVVKNSSFTVLDASIKMAFKLFYASKRINEERMKNEAAYEEMQVINDNLLQIQSNLIETEKNLRQSEEKYRYIDESSLDSIYSYDRQGRFTHANRALCNLLGLRYEDIIGKTHEELGFPIEQCEEWAGLHQQVYDTDRTVIAVTETPIPNSQSKYFEVVLNPIHDDEGFIIGIAGTTRDITEHKKAEQELREYQDRLKFALDATGLGEWEYNLTTNKIVRSERWAEMLGYNLTELDDSLQGGIDLQHPDDRASVAKAVKEYHEGRTDQFKCSYRMKTKNGDYKWIQDCGKVYERNEFGNPLLIYGTHQDIDALKKTEESMTTSRNLLESILESSPEVIVFALDNQYRYLAFNSKHKEAIKQIWGKEISVGTNMLEIIGAHEDSKKAKNNFDRALRGESFVLVEQYGDEILSRQSWVDYWSPIRSSDGSVVGITCFVLNNTEQKKAEARVETLLREKELLLKEVHHRIKNNMNTVSSLLSLQESVVSDASAKSALQDAANRIHSMSVLYDKLYRSSDFLNLSISDYLSVLVDEVVSNYSNSKLVVVEKNIQEFTLDVRYLQPIGIMINELIANIMKHAFRDCANGVISVSAIKINNRINISVQDNGVGIPDSITLENSTGFGLQLLSALTQQLEGTIRIERGDGTKVILEFDA